jgi:hypothetical protein
MERASILVPAPDSSTPDSSSETISAVDHDPPALEEDLADETSVNHPVLTRPPRPITVEEATTRVETFKELLSHGTDSVSDSQMSQITSKYEQLEGSVEGLRKLVPDPHLVNDLIHGLAEVRIAQSQLTTEMKAHQRETDAKLKSIITGLQALASGSHPVPRESLGPLVTEAARAQALDNIVRAASVPIVGDSGTDPNSPPVAAKSKRKMRVL